MEKLKFGLNTAFAVLTVFLLSGCSETMHPYEPAPSWQQSKCSEILTSPGSDIPWCQADFYKSNEVRKARKHEAAQIELEQQVAQWRLKGKI